MTQLAPLDPALAEHLAELTDLLHEIGAEGIWLIRDTGQAKLIFDLLDRAAPGDKTEFFQRVGPAGILLLARFPAGDGGQLQVEALS